MDKPGGVDAAALRAELETMKPRALKKRCAEVGVDDAAVDEADDADDVKGTLVALIIDRVVRVNGSLDAASEPQLELTPTSADSQFSRITTSPEANLPAVPLAVALELQCDSNPNPTELPEAHLPSAPMAVVSELQPESNPNPTGLPEAHLPAAPLAVAPESQSNGTSTPSGTGNKCRASKSKETNDEGAVLSLNSAKIAYCGRTLGLDAIPGSDGDCGPDDGPQCQSCKRFQRAKRLASISKKHLITAFWEVTDTNAKTIRLELSASGCPSFFLDGELRLEDVPHLQFDPTGGQVIISGSSSFEVSATNCKGQWLRRDPKSSDRAEAMHALWDFCSFAMIPYSMMRRVEESLWNPGQKKSGTRNPNPLFKTIKPKEEASPVCGTCVGNVQCAGCSNANMSSAMKAVRRADPAAKAVAAPGFFAVAGFTAAKKATEQEQDALLCALVDIYAEDTPKRWEVITAEFNIRSSVEQADGWGKRRLKKIRSGVCI